MDISNDNRVGKDSLIHGTSRYKHVEPGNMIRNIISHPTSKTLEL
jgi:hypothetical protein